MFTRKPQFQYGWDWGPKLNIAGIHKSVYLKAWNNILVDDIHVVIDTLTTEVAHLTAQLEVDVHELDEFDAELFVNDILITKKNIKTESKTVEFSIPFTIQNPKLWWTHNLGDPYQYKIHVKLRKGRTTYAQKELMYGIRTIKLITEKDDVGEKFYFELNGEPVFMKGANYIPQHSLNEHQAEDTERLIEDAKKANMNMLRVWGGGTYEDDYFYELCDKKGILVWQDFMFACAMYPGDTSFLNNVKEEAVQQVKRLRNHASIALWCGNNESAEGWKRWGWQQDRSETEIQEIWGNYQKLFNELLPNVVMEHSTTSYWESSPKYGRGNPNYRVEGDAHDWWVWHDGKPFEHFQQAIPRFMSEFGFQSYPTYKAIKYLTASDSISLADPAFKTHQKHARGDQLIATYMERDYIVPENDLDYVYTSQLVQARGITLGIEAHRSAKPYCMGSLFWQLNDCWPVVSWSSIDGLGEWKALHYKVQRSFDNMLLSMVYSEDKVKITLVNDNLEPVTDTLKLALRDFYGNVLWEEEKNITVRSNSSEVVYEFEPKKAVVNLDEVYMYGSFKGKEKTFIFVSPKSLKLPEEDILIKYKKINDGYELTLSSKVFVKDVFLSTNTKGFFEENFFDIHPNAEKVIVFKTASLEAPEFVIQSLNKIYQDSLLK